MMFGPECQLNFQLWQRLLCPGSQGLLRTEAIYLLLTGMDFTVTCHICPLTPGTAVLFILLKADLPVRALTQQESSDT